MGVGSGGHQRAQVPSAAHCCLSDQTQVSFVGIWAQYTQTLSGLSKEARYLVFDVEFPKPPNIRWAKRNPSVGQTQPMGTSWTLGSGREDPSSETRQITWRLGLATIHNLQTSPMGTLVGHLESQMGSSYSWSGFIWGISMVAIRLALGLSPAHQGLARASGL